MVYQRVSQRALLLTATLGLAHAVAVPEPTAAPAMVEVRAPIVTPPANPLDARKRYLEERNILSDIVSDVEGVAASWGSVLGSALPSFFTEGKLSLSSRAGTSKACTYQA